VHAEYDYESDGHVRRIVLAESTNLGASWTDVGDIVTPDDDYSPPVEGAVDIGDGDQRLAIDSSGGYFYLFYWTGYYTSSTTVIWENVARCPISDAMAPGCWTKWYDGSFSQAGLGGHDGQIMSWFTPGSGNYDYYSGPFVTYDTYLGEFIAIGHNWISTATSLSTENWTQPVAITGGLSAVQCNYIWPFDTSSNSSYSVGESFRFYGAGPACNYQATYQVINFGGNPVGETEWYASNGFTQDPWRYQYTTNGGSSFSPMYFDTSTDQWTGTEEYCTVFGPNEQHPGSSGCESSRTWQAPYGATVTIGANGPISVVTGCGGNTAGVNLQIFKNGTQIWPSSGSHNIPNGDSYTFPSGVTTTVNEGDNIEFVVSNSGSVNYCDSTTWDQTVTDTSTDVLWQASDWFTEGWDQWRYLYTTNGGSSFSPMYYDISALEWVGTEEYCTVFGPNEQHPGSSGCESARTWQAPYDATITIGANGPISVVAGCGGNTAGVNLRIFQNDTQIWPSSGSHNIPNGDSYTFPSGVTANVNEGDNIEFVVSNAGSVNYCDSTLWDPSISVT
jgi:hypothetical protein